MKVFLSWSGYRSRAVAEALSAWLQQLIQAVEPWLSAEIEKGTRWGPAITAQLDQSRAGIIILTRENLDARWLLFEAGALPRSQDAKLYTFLLDVAPQDVEYPLAQFQHTKFEKNEMMALAHAINEEVQRAGERALDRSLLPKLFEQLWPSLRESLEAVKRQDTVAEPVREERELLSEILDLVRAQNRRLDSFARAAFQSSSRVVVASPGSGKTQRLLERMLGTTTMEKLAKDLEQQSERGGEQGEGGLAANAEAHDVEVEGVDLSIWFTQGVIKDGVFDDITKPVVPGETVAFPVYSHEQG